MTSSGDAITAWAPPPLAGDSRAPRRAALTPDAGWTLPEMAADGAVAAVDEGPDDYARGFEDGVIQGTARAESELAPAASALGRLVEALAREASEFALARERNLHALALAIARRLIQREVTADPAVVRDLVARGLELTPGDAAIEVRLNPTDYQALADVLAHVAGPERRVQWVAETSLERGSFVIETPARIVDGRTDTALRTLYERLDRD